VRENCAAEGLVSVSTFVHMNGRRDALWKEALAGLSFSRGKSIANKLLGRMIGEDVTRFHRKGERVQ